MLISIVSANHCFGAERILQEWTFNKASDMLGWTAAEPVGELKVQDGALHVKPGTGMPKLEGPLFNIEAAPWQYIEIEMKSDGAGSGLIYFSNTTDEPYHGFRPGQLTSFNVKPGSDYQTYRIYPFWQRHKTITHIRVDAPGNDIYIRTIRIIGASSDSISKEASWMFKDTDCGWRPINSTAETKASPQGWKIKGTNESTILSPAVDISANDNSWATIRVVSTSQNAISFKWSGDSFDGMRTIPVELIGDGQPHSYNLQLSKLKEWAGKIMLFGITPTQSTDSKSINLLSFAVGDKPSGPPEIRIAKFYMEDAFVRVGQKTKLIAEVTNIGGADAKAISVMLSLPNEKQANSMLPKQIGKIEPGKTVKCEWTIEAKSEDPVLAVCRANAHNVPGEQKSIDLEFYPKLDPNIVKGLKYVPEPQAVQSDYLVGAYYFPGWFSYDRWAVLNDYPERRPILGYYREGEPEIADWQINWALSHGINYFIYDWYWSAGARMLENGLHKAFFNSKYQDKMKFCLLWANHNGPGTSSDKDMIDVTKYWIENYFNKPNYLKINGKNVMVIFSPERFTQDMGKDAVKASFTKMKKMCEDAGVGGLYMVTCMRPYEGAIKECEYEGYDAFSGYNYPEANTKGQMYSPYEWMVDGYKDFWTRISDMSTIPYIPVCEPGWDSRPWHGYEAAVRTGKNPELWQKMLENAKAFTDDPKHKLPEGKKLVFLEAWNEFGEGDYIEPQAQFGFDYLEAVRTVFAPQSKKPTIIVPKDLGMGPYDCPIPEPKLTWDFSKPEDRVWIASNMANLSFENGTMRAETVDTDPIIYSQMINVDPSKLKTIEIKMKADKSDQAQMFFQRTQAGWSEQQSVRFNVTGDNEFHVYTIDMSQNAKWRYDITQLRFDPTSTKGCKIDIAYIKIK